MNTSIFVPLRTLGITICFLMLSTISTAQKASNKTTSDFWDNVRFGGGVGLSFGDGFFSATLAPQAIYQVNQTVGLGIGLNGTINNRRNLYNSTIIGGSVISTFNVLQGIQLSAEFEELNVNRDFDNDFITNLEENYWYSALFFGAAYRAGNIAFGIRYDVLYDEETSIYAEPWVPFVRVLF